MNKEEIILENILLECDTHQERMKYAYNKLTNLFPITPEGYEQLSEENISHLDQYIFRFSKLQDAIGRKLFKAILQWQGENTDEKSVKDIFNRLEQLGAVADYTTWNRLRLIRNDSAHEYAENKVELVEKLNALFQSYSLLIGYLSKMKMFIISKKP